MNWMYSKKKTCNDRSERNKIFILSFFLFLLLLHDAGGGGGGGGGAGAGAGGGWMVPSLLHSGE